MRADLTVKEAMDLGFETCSDYMGRIYRLDELDPLNVPDNLFVQKKTELVVLDSVRDKFIFECEDTDSYAGYLIYKVPDDIWSDFLDKVNIWLKDNPMKTIKVSKARIINRRL